jgi:SAM-dependent methyltransferase
MRNERQLISTLHLRSAYRLVLSFLPNKQQQWLVAQRRRWGVWPVRGFVRFGSLRRLDPLSVAFEGRGSPIDRYYIERFLEQHSEDICGRVLECADNEYTMRFGDKRVTRSDILSIEPDNPRATFVGDLAGYNELPDEVFDCIILTQVLQCIYDLKASVSTLYRILRPGGVILATMPGIAPALAEPWPLNWTSTTVSAEQLFREVFPADQISVGSHGNIFVAIAFLHGIASEELRQSELDYHDPSYAITIAVRAVKPKASKK